MRKILQTALLFLSLIVYAPAFAQNTGGSITIRGSVVDDQNAPLPGVTVRLKGSTTGVNTGANGNYLITVPANSKTLVFSFVGMQTQEIAH